MKPISCNRFRTPIFPTTTNGVVFEGSAADDYEGTLLAGTLGADRTYTLPNKTGTVAMTSDITGTNSGTNTGDETKSSINALDITEVGTISSGVWNGSAISTTYLSGQSGTNTGDETLATIKTKLAVTILSGDNNTLLVLSATTSKTITYDSGLTENFAVEFINIGTGTWTHSQGTGSLNNPDGTIMLANRVAMMIHIGTSGEYWLKGELE